MQRLESAKDQELLDAETLAQILDVSKLTVYRWARLGQVPFVKFGPKIIRFRLRDFEKFSDGRRETGA